MENENKIPAQMEEKKKNKKRFRIGKALVWLGSTALLMWWTNHYFALKNHTHDFLTAARRGGANNILVIDDDNMEEYIKDWERVGADGKTYKLGNRYGYVLQIPQGYDAVIIATTNRYTLSILMPEDGEFDDGTRITLLGNFRLRPYESCDGFPDAYMFSNHIYMDQNNNAGHDYFDGYDKNGCELLCWRKEWYFIV